MSFRTYLQQVVPGAVGQDPAEAIRDAMTEIEAELRSGPLGARWGAVIDAMNDDPNLGVRIGLDCNQRLGNMDLADPASIQAHLECAEAAMNVAAAPPAEKSNMPLIIGGAAGVLLVLWLMRR